MKSIVIYTLLFAWAGFASGADLVQEKLSRGLYEEEVKRNFDGAIESYRAVLESFDQQKKSGAIAVFRLAECLRKQGKTEEANQYYARLLREFPGETDLVQQARKVYQGKIEETTTVASNSLDEEEFEIKRLSKLLKDSPDLINASIEFGTDWFQPLHRAAMKGQPKLAKFLLEAGADVDAKDTGNQMIRAGTPLHYAAAFGHKAVLEILLQHKATVDALDEYGCTPLQYAVYKGFNQIIDLLLKNGADPSHTSPKNQSASGFNFSGNCLHIAVQQNHRSLVEKFLATGKVDINAETGLGGTTALGLSALDPVRLAVMSLLIDRGADLNKGSDTPVFKAVLTKNEPGLKLLLSKGADPNGGSRRERKTALQVAIEGRYLNGVHLLLEKKPDLDLKDSNLNSYLGQAILNTLNLEIIKALVDHGANINYVNPTWVNTDKGGMSILDLVALARIQLHPDNRYSVDSHQDVSAYLRSKGAKTAEELTKEKKP